MTLQPHELVLFQGDSITNAFRMPEEVGTSYRMGAGYAMIISALLQATRPNDGLRFENRGVSGNGLAQLSARWEQDTVAMAPNVLSILVGVNATLAAMRGAECDSPTVFRRRYHELLTRTRQELPGIRLVLCEPFLLCAGTITPAYRDDLGPRQQAVCELAQEFNAVFVPLQEPLDRAARITGPAYWLFDGIHPNAAAQWLIAGQWLQATGLADGIPGLEMMGAP